MVRIKGKALSPIITSTQFKDFGELGTINTNTAKTQTFKEFKAGLYAIPVEINIFNARRYYCLFKIPIEEYEGFKSKDNPKGEFYNYFRKFIEYKVKWNPEISFFERKTINLMVKRFTEQFKGGNI